MHRQLRDISGDLKERADLLARQINAAQARIQALMMELKKEKAIQQQRLETELQAIHRLINIVTVQHALHRGLKSAVAALDTIVDAKPSKKQLQKEEKAEPAIQAAPSKESAPGDCSRHGAPCLPLNYRSPF
jgi:hypothetical protein